MIKPLEDIERSFAEVAARLIAKAAEVGLPDTPDKLVPLYAIRLLARSHVELTDALRTIHDRIEQIVRASIDGALGEVVRQQGDVASAILDEARSEGVRAAKLLVTSLSPRPPDASDRAPSAPSGPRVVRVPIETAASSDAELIALYCRVMHASDAFFTAYPSYVVRLWDGIDGCWTDCTEDVAPAAALRHWAEKTDGGTHHVTFDEIDYYRIFPGDTRMAWDGSRGRAMSR